MNTIADYLHKHPLLQGIPASELESTASRMDPQQYRAGEMILREGSLGDDAFFVVEGVVRVYTRNLIGKPILIAELGPGHIIGEIALLITEKRSASIRAQSDTTVYRIARHDFKELSASSPLVHESLQMSAEIRYVHTLLRRASIWSAIPESELRGLAEITVRRQFKQGDVIVREGDSTKQLYLVTNGRFEVRHQGKRKAILGAGDYFGEVSLLADILPTDTVVALEAGELLLMGEAEFTYVLQQYPPVLMQFTEVFRIRRPDLPLHDTFIDMIAAQETNPSSSPIKSYHKDLFGGNWVPILFGLGGLFFAFTLLSIFLEQAVWRYAALLSGALVGPVTFVSYLRNSQLLGFRTSKLVYVFLLSGFIAIPLAWVMEQLWVVGAGSGMSFADIRTPIVIAVIEELAKLLLCGWLLWLRRYRFLMDAIVFGAAAGMGFAAIESIIYGWSQLASESTGGMLAVLWVRALLSPFGHGTWTAIAAAGIWHGTIGQGRRRILLACCLPIIAILLHTLWNYDITSGMWHMFIMLLIGAVGLWILYGLIRKGRRDENQSLIRINPLLDDGNELSEWDEAEERTTLVCEGCFTQSPPHARYCARCGQSLRLKRAGSS